MIISSRDCLLHQIIVSLVRKLSLSQEFFIAEMNYVNEEMYIMNNMNNGMVSQQLVVVNNL